MRGDALENHQSMHSSEQADDEQACWGFKSSIIAMMLMNTGGRNGSLSLISTSHETHEVCDAVQPLVLLGSSSALLL